MSRRRRVSREAEKNARFFVHFLLLPVLYIREAIPRGVCGGIPLAPASERVNQISAGGATECSPTRKRGVTRNKVTQPQRGVRFGAPHSYAPTGLYRRAQLTHRLRGGLHSVAPPALNNLFSNSSPGLKPGANGLSPLLDYQAAGIFSSWPTWILSGLVSLSRFASKIFM